MFLKLASFCVVVFLVASRAEVADVTQEVQDAFLAAHNAARNAVGVSSLTWDKTLSDFAASWGAKCIFKHSGGPYGENIFGSWPSSNNNAAVAGEAVNFWVDEIKNVDPPAWSCVSSRTATCGHYSQVVWRNTQNVGCAIIHCDAASKGPGNYVVCEYSPRGNYIGMAPY